METLSLQPQTFDEIDWHGLSNDLARNRVVLLLGPYLPLYPNGTEKLDFNSITSLHLSHLLLEANFPFDHSQSTNLFYTAQKFIAFKKNYRTRLEDEIADLYKVELEKIKSETNNNIPELYRKILKLPWHTIINTQPDNFFEEALKPNDVFSYYHFRNKDHEPKKVNDDQFLVYNLCGVFVKEKSNYRVDSLVLTEEDQVEFMRNLVSENPRIPENVLSRFDNEKTYIFLDCNLEDWHFRLLLEALKIHRESHTFSSRRPRNQLPSSAVEFYKNRYGFVFVNDNSEDFIDTLLSHYHPPDKKVYPPKKLFLAYDTSNEETARALKKQLELHKERNLAVWWKEDLEAADPISREVEEMNSADAILLLVNADFLAGPGYSNYVKPALARVGAGQHPAKVFVVIESGCAWDQTELNTLSQKYILPSDRIPIRQQSQQDSNKILYEIANSITRMLWE